MLRSEAPSYGGHSGDLEAWGSFPTSLWMAIATFASDDSILRGWKFTFWELERMFQWALQMILFFSQRHFVLGKCWCPFVYGPHWPIGRMRWQTVSHADKGMITLWNTQLWMHHGQVLVFEHVFLFAVNSWNMLHFFFSVSFKIGKEIRLMFLLSRSWQEDLSRRYLADAGESYPCLPPRRQQENMWLLICQLDAQSVHSVKKIVQKKCFDA